MDYTGLKEMYENGATLRECSKYLGMAQEKARVELKRVGANLRPSGGVRKQIKIDELKEMYENGSTLRECAKHLGLSHEKIRIELKRMGVNLKHYDFLLKKFLEVKGTDAPKKLVGRGIGNWIIRQRQNIFEKFKKEMKNSCRLVVN